MRSNLWPGAFAFARGEIADMIYVGWGHKYCSRNYLPSALPQMYEEYPLGPDILEINDPSVAEEKEYRQKQDEKLVAAEENTDNEGEESEEEEEDEEN